jgi:hypothetical protein
MSSSARNQIPPLLRIKPRRRGSTHSPEAVRLMELGIVERLVTTRAVSTVEAEPARSAAGAAVSQQVRSIHLRRIRRTARDLVGCVRCRYTTNSVVTAL